MASASLPVPGSELGPCVPECQHKDCAATRRMAAVPCSNCSEPIGYDRSFYRAEDDGGDWSRLVHADCYEREIERKHERYPSLTTGG